VVPIVFWGNENCQGREEFSLENSPTALILMGDWCGPKSDTDRLKIGMRNPDDQTLGVESSGEEKKFFSAGKSLPI
jgi:hypothetical protein